MVTFVDRHELLSGGSESIPQNAGLLMRRGLLVALGSDSPSLVQRMNLEAAKEMRYVDMTRDEALALVTIGPAKILGLASRLGSIEPGKDADLVLFDRDPMSVYARVEKTMIDGVIIYDRERDYDRFVASPPVISEAPPAAPPEAPIQAEARR